MSAFYSGSSGFLIYDGKKAAKVQNWQFASNLSTLDTTTLGDLDRSAIAGTRSLSGSCRLYYYDYTSGATKKNDAGVLIKKIIKTNGSASEAVQLSLGFVGDDGSNKTITFNAFVTSASMAMAVGEVLSADIQFQAAGAPSGITI